MGWQSTLATIFQGSGFQFNSQGEFFYSTPTPTAGNLLYSITNAAGTDSAGNAFLAGATSYENQGSGIYVAVNQYNGQVSFYQSTGEAGPWTLLGVLVYNHSAGTLSLDAPALASLDIGPNTVGVEVGNIAAGLTLQGAPISLITGTGESVQWNNLFLDRSASDVSVFTNPDNAGATALTAVYPIATDVQAGTRLEIEMPFYATMEGETLQLGLSLNGSVVFSGSVTIGAAIVGSGIGLLGMLKFGIEFTAVGPSGAFTAYGGGSIQQGGANVLFTNTAGPAVNPNNSTAINTTLASNNLRINSLWGAAAAGQTVSGVGSTFTRKGP